MSMLALVLSHHALLVALQVAVGVVDRFERLHEAGHFLAQHLGQDGLAVREKLHGIVIAQDHDGDVGLDFLLDQRAQGQQVDRALNTIIHHLAEEFHQLRRQGPDRVCRNA
ncbi:hypothetical protein LP419_34080 [Massilia sp. H-1]|nr:hypothetical protein LP419_34080 [Massilia sp. H-1]